MRSESVETPADQGGDQFHALALLTTTGREIRFTSGQTTTVTAAFTATGVPLSRLRIRSTMPAAAAFLNLAPGATQHLDAVDVADNHATGQPLGPGPAANYASIKGSNSDRWFELLAVMQVPTLSAVGLVLLATSLTAIAALRLLRRSVSGSGGRAA